MTTPAPTQNNPFLNLGALDAGTPSSSDTTRFGMTTTELGTSLAVSNPQVFGTPGFAAVPGGAAITSETNLDPFGIGVRMNASNGQVTVQDLLDYIQQLPPSQLAQVQSELANAGFYGVMNSPTSEPHWGQLGSVDAAAISNFVKTALNGAQNGSSIQSVLARATQQFGAQQQLMNTRTPVKDMGKNYVITNLDSAEAGDMVDQVALKTLGHTLDPSQRQQYSQWLNQLYTSRQVSADQGDIEQNALNAQATAQASDWVDPLTGRALDYNGVVAAARSQMGVKYVWGGETAGQAFDCSGLSQWVYSQNGINLPRTSQEQWNTADGTKFNDESQAQPGDLVFFGGDGTGPTHVGIYIGNGMMINAPHTGANVEIDNVQSFAQGDNLVGFKHFGQVNDQAIAATNLPTGTSAASGGAAGGGELNTFMAAEKQQESGGDYTVTNSIGASGAYQMLQSTWNEWAAKAGYGQYVGQPAAAAPPNVQDAVAQTAFSTLYSQYGNWGDVAATWYSGQPLNAATAGAAQNDGPSIQGYVDGILSKMKTMGASATALGGGPAPGSSDVGQESTLTSGLDENGGRSIISTPNTFTQATDESTTALQDALALRLRQDFPDQATGADYANAYNMLKSSIDSMGFQNTTAGSTSTGGTGG